MSNVTFDIEDLGIECLFDIDVLRFRHRWSHYSISKVTNLRYRRSWAGLPIPRFLAYDIEQTPFDIVCWYRIRCRRSFWRSTSKVMSQHIGFDIVYDIAFTQCHSQRSGSSLCPGTITPAPKSLRATRPGFMHPLFPQLDPQRIDEERSFHSATSTCWSHVDFKKPAPCPTVGSKICCSFLWELNPEAARDGIDWVAVQVTWNQRHTSKVVCPARFQISNIG
jgi:hypothetical protein